MIKERRVVITGMGVISPVGNDIETFWDNIKNGRCGISKLREEHANQGLPIHVAAYVKDFDPARYGITPADKRRNDQYSQFAQGAAFQAMQQSGLVSGENIAPERFGVYFGSGIGGLDTFTAQTEVFLKEGASRVSPLFAPMMIPNVSGGNIAIKYQALGPCVCHVAACATSTNSIGEAYLAIKYNRADAILSGGSDAVVRPLALGCFANSRALTTEEDPAKACIPFDNRRSGFVMGEGAGALVLEEYEHAKARGAKILAELCGYGCTCDAYHYTSPRPDAVPTGTAIRLALEEAGYREGENLYMNAHGTSTHFNDVTETKALKLALGEEEAHRASISSTKSMHGHLFGGTGAVECISCVLALQNDLIPPTIGLEEPDPDCDLDYTPGVARERELDIAISNSLGFGGHNVCIALRKCE